MHSVKNVAVNSMKKFALNIIKKWQLILYISLMLGAVTFLVSTMITPKYRSDITVLIVQKGANTLTASKNADYIGNIFKETLMAEPFLRGVLKTDSSIQREFSKDAKKREKEWKSEVRYEMIEGAGIFKISVFDPKNEDSQKIANGIVNHFKEASSDYFGEYGEKEEIEMKVIDGPITSAKVAYPNIILNTILGFIVGLFGSLLIVHFYEGFDLRLFGGQKRFKKETSEENIIEQQVEEQLARQLNKRKDKVALEYLSEFEDQDDFDVSENVFIPEVGDKIAGLEKDFGLEERLSAVEELEYVSLPEDGPVDFKQTNEDIELDEEVIGEEIKKSIEQAKKAKKKEEIKESVQEIEIAEPIQEKENFWENMRAIDEVSSVDIKKETEITPLIEDSLVDMETYRKIIQAGETFRGFRKIQEKGQIAGIKEVKDVVEKKDEGEDSEIESKKNDKLEKLSKGSEKEIKKKEETERETERVRKIEKKEEGIKKDIKEIVEKTTVKAQSSSKDASSEKVEKTKKTKEIEEKEFVETALNPNESDMFRVGRFEKTEIKEADGTKSEEKEIVKEEQKKKPQIEEPLELSAVGLKNILKTQSSPSDEIAPEKSEVKKAKKLETKETEKDKEAQEREDKSISDITESSLPIKKQEEIQEIESMEFIGSLDETIYDEEVDTENENWEKVGEESGESVEDTEEFEEIEDIVKKRKQEEKLELERVLVEESKEELIESKDEQQKAEDLETAREVSRIEAQIQQMSESEEKDEVVDKDDLENEIEEIESIEYIGNASQDEDKTPGTDLGLEVDSETEVQRSSAEEPQKKNIFSRLYEKSIFNDKKFEQQREERTEHHFEMDPEELEMMRKMLEAEGTSTEEFAAENELLTKEDGLVDKDVTSGENVENTDKQKALEPVTESVRKIEAAERIGQGSKKGQAPAGLPVFIEQENEQDAFARQFLDRKDPIKEEREKKAIQSLPNDLPKKNEGSIPKEEINPDKEASEEEIKEKLNKLLQGEL